MSYSKQNDAASRSNDNSVRRNERVRRLLLYAAGLLAVFLLGLIPMWMTARPRLRSALTRAKRA